MREQDRDRLMTALAQVVLLNSPKDAATEELKAALEQAEKSNERKESKSA